MKTNQNVHIKNSRSVTTNKLGYSESGRVHKHAKQLQGSLDKEIEFNQETITALYGFKAGERYFTSPSSELKQGDWYVEKGSLCPMKAYAVDKKDKVVYFSKGFGLDLSLVYKCNFV